MLSVIAIDEAIVTKMLVALQKCGNALVGGCGTARCALCTVQCALCTVGGCGSANITFVGYFNGQPLLFHYHQDHSHNLQHPKLLWLKVPE